MSLFEIVVLALLQGLTEFLPVSSSAHLILPSAVLGWSDQGLAFDVAVHVGTLAAVVVYFRRDLYQLWQGWFRQVTGGGSSSESHLAWCVVIGTIPAGLAGFVFEDWIEANLRAAEVIAIATIVFGLLLGVADRMRGTRSIHQLGMRDALLIGVAQAIALIPGTSRSGITMTAALIAGYDRDTAARFSFLLSIPLILAAGGLKTLELVQLGEAAAWTTVITGALIAGVSAYACIHVFLKFLQRIGFMPFVYYRLVLGSALLLWLYFAA